MTSTCGSESFYGMPKTNINLKNHITLVKTGAARSAIALEAYGQDTNGSINRNGWKPKLRHGRGEGKREEESERERIRPVGYITVYWKMAT